MPLFALGDRRPKIDDLETVWIAPTAVLIGDVRLDAEASIWFGSVLRGDNEQISVGRGSNVQENCTLHTDMGYPLTIGADCTIGHGVILHGCTIGDQSLIGMGATVLNGAQIGWGSLVGANALVTENKTFPDRSLIVGSPAKAIRTLSDEEVDGLLKSAQNYVANWRRFKSELSRID